MEPQTPGQPEYTSTTPIPPPPVISPAAPPLPQQSARPTAALVIGILLLVFAGFGLIGLFSNIAALGAIKNMSVGSMMMPTYIYIVPIIVSLLNIGLYTPMGIGLLTVKPWARQGAIISIVIIALASMLQQVVSLMGPLPGMPEAMGEMTQLIIVASLVVGVVFNIGVNGTMLFFLTRPKMVQAFAKKR